MKWSRRIKNLLVKEGGPTTVEYAILLLLVAGMITTSLVYLGDGVRQTNETVVDGMNSVVND